MLSKEELRSLKPDTVTFVTMLDDIHQLCREVLVRLPEKRPSYAVRHLREARATRHL
jgi:hypothetical protein